MLAILEIIYKKFSVLLILGVSISCSPASIDKIIRTDFKPVISANHNFSRTGYQPVYLPDSLAFEQEESLRGLPYQTLLSYSGYMMFTTHNGFLYFIEHADFDNITKSSLAEGITVAPSIDYTWLYCAASKGKEGLIAFDMINGEVVWTKSGRYSQSSPVIADSLVIHASLNGYITAFEKLTGQHKWQIQQSDKILNSLALSESNLIIAGQNGIIKNINPKNGSLNWSLDLKSAVYASPVISKKDIFIASYKGTITKIDLQTGNKLSENKLNVELLQTPVVDPNYIYVPLASGKIVALAQSDLKPLWSRTLEGPFSCPPLLIRDELIVGTAAKYLYRINIKDGSTKQVLKIDGRPRSQPLVYNQKLYIGYEPDYISVFSVKRSEK